MYKHHQQNELNEIIEILTHSRSRNVSYRYWADYKRVMFVIAGRQYFITRDTKTKFFFFKEQHFRTNVTEAIINMILNPNFVV